MPIRIATVVEGHAEVEAVPVLIRRFAEQSRPLVHAIVPPPVRVARSKLLKPGELERAVTLAAHIAEGGAVLVLIDADDDCPAQLGPALLHRALVLAARRFPVSVVLANMEFEAWFLAAAESLRGSRGLPGDLEPPQAAESVRDAKGWLSERMIGTSRYSEVLDQPALAAVMDLEAARTRSDSFEKFSREVIHLLKACESV